MTLARTTSVAAARRRGPPRRGRGRPRRRAARRDADRPAGRGAARGQGPDPGRDRELRARPGRTGGSRVALLPGDAAQARRVLRPRDRGRRARGGRAAAGRARSTAWCCSASSAWTARLRPIRGVLPAVIAAARRRDPPGRRAGGERWPRRARARAWSARRRGRWPTCWRSCAATPAGRPPGRSRRPPAGPPAARPRRRGRAGGRPAGGRGGRGRRAPPAAHRAARRRARRCWPSGCPALLPPLDDEEALEVTAVHSVAGAAAAGRAAGAAGRRSRRRTTRRRSRRWSAAARGLARPGAVSLAHRGVLFLDEAPEFQAGVLDALRQPLESGVVAIARAGGVARLPGPLPAGAGGQPVPVRGAGRRTRTACAPRRPGAATSGGSPARCSTGSTCRCSCEPVRAGRSCSTGGQRPSRPRRWPRGWRRRGRWRPSGWAAPAGGSTPTCPARPCAAAWRLPAAVTAAADARLDRGELTARGYDRVLRVAWSLARPGRAAPGRARPTSRRPSPCGRHWSTP